MEYFAIKADIQELMDRIEKFYQRLYQVGHTQKIQRSHYLFFGQNGGSSYLNRTGEMQEKHAVVVNDFRSLAEHVVTLVTAQRRSYDARATNSDYKSQVQTVLAEQILDYYLREKKLERLQKKAMGYAVRYGEGFVVMDWDVKGGNLYTVDENGNPVNDGDIRYRVKHRLDIIQDLEQEQEHDWSIVVDYANKHDMAVRYPEHEKGLLACEISQQSNFDQYRNIDYRSQHSTADKFEDLIPVYTFYHRKCAVLPEGRMIIFTEGLRLLDSPLPYSEIPIYRVSAGDLDGTCLGYTPLFDLQCLAETTDKLYSAVVSNNLSFATQCLQTTPDADVNVSDLADGMKLLETNAEIKPVQLTASSPETYNLISTLTTKMQEITGINEVVRGSPGPNLRSGNALALVAAQALTYNSNLEQSFTELFEDTGTATIRFLKDFATTPRFAGIVGKYKKSYMKEFQGSDLENFDRVTVEQQSSIARTTAGKIEVATNLLEQNLITKPEQYIAVLETGRLDPLIEGDQAEIFLVRAENEKLAEGIQVPALPTDKHQMHILEHKGVLSNPEVRQDAKVTEVVLEHLMSHIELVKTTDPLVLALSGNQPPPIPQGGPPAAPPSQVTQPPTPGPQDLPDQPSLPEDADPLTQESYGNLQAMQQ